MAKIEARVAYFLNEMAIVSSITVAGRTCSSLRIAFLNYFEFVVKDGSYRWSGIAYRSLYDARRPVCNGHCKRKGKNERNNLLNSHVHTSFSVMSRAS
ncbi:MAG TPA: hypothetical protein VJH03_23035 [Blastocatellia bacterium]|nr:hypothetical protein [Blastocatellia bacterium]